MEPTHGQEGNSPCLVHVVSVSQPVQSWTVIRDHVDFVALGNALSTIIRGLPTCPTPPPQSNGPEDNTRIVTARNALQEWLTSVLFVPGARENPAVRQFLCYGANIVHPNSRVSLGSNLLMTTLHTPQQEMPQSSHKLELQLLWPLPLLSHWMKWKWTTCLDMKLMV